mgnify:CR=1
LELGNKGVFMKNLEILNADKTQCSK